MGAATDSAGRFGEHRGRESGAWHAGHIVGHGRDRLYVTVEGDTLETIAADLYGDGGVRRLIEANLLADDWSPDTPFPAGVPLRAPAAPAPDGATGRG